MTWTIETLKEHLEAKIDAHTALDRIMWDNQSTALSTAITASRELTAAALQSTTLAIQKAELATEKRFESVNEFRGQMADQQRTLMPRAEVEVIVRGFEQKLAVHEAALAESRSVKKGALEGWGWAVGVFGAVALAYSLLR